MKVICITILFTLFYSLLPAQNSFTLLLKKDSTLTSYRFEIFYYNGKAKILVPDSFVNNRMQITGPFISEFVTLTISPTINGESLTSEVFFISDGRSAIEMHRLKPSGTNEVQYRTERARLINDPVSFEPYRRITDVRRAAAECINELWEKHSAKMFQDDSLRRILSVYVKQMNQKTLEYLKQQPFDYFSLWFLRSQVFDLSVTTLKTDTSYLKYLKTYALNTIPPKYLKTFEVQNMIVTLDGLISPPKTNTIAADFSKKDITGKRITLSQIKSDFILLDFWATWCPPCMAGVSHLKELKKKFPSNVLTIVGVSVDHSLQTLKKTVSDNKMAWIHFYDEDNYLSNKYAVTVYPTYIIIDRNRNIVFRGESGNDSNKLREIIERLSTGK